MAATKKKPQTKTSFIMSFAPGTPTAEIVDKAKAQKFSGKPITAKLIYAIRSEKKSKKAGKAKPSRTTLHHVEHVVALRQAILDLGYDAALRLLHEERARLMKA